MTRPRVAADSRTFLLVLGAAVVAAGCGSSEDGAAPRPAQTAHATQADSVTIEEIEAHNDAARRRARVQRRQRAAEARRRAAPSNPAAAVEKPPITPALIPFPASRRREMAAYAQRHYGLDTYRLRSPEVIVEHYTETADARSAIDIFRPDVADSELHELPGVCAHFVIDRDGTIFQVVPLSIMCRHTVGLNYTSVGIEMAGFSAREILDNAAQMKSSLALTRWLRCRYEISIGNVIGHNESRSSPYHRENVARLRTQTHEDWTKAETDVYRDRLERVPC